MKPIFQLPSDSPLASAITEGGDVLPVRVPAGWHVIHNTFTARQLPDGRVETYDSEDLYWARTERLPWLTEQEWAEQDALRARDINMDVGWYGGSVYRVVLFETDWDHVLASHTTSGLDDLVGTMERWMWLVTAHDELPGS